MPYEASIPLFPNLISSVVSVTLESERPSLLCICVHAHIYIYVYIYMYAHDDALVCVSV